ncbi:hypothetical protein WJX81_007004 [Elliptochloris bilobata]|uniref:Uncharacterized protein n=1 Tax=Elliptochloris bilobata TaxID=381761 RepID=A0AAW1SM49_9CHLO
MLMEQVIVTGSSKGLGYALAEHFLALGDDVVISSRSSEACNEAAKRLAALHPQRRVRAFAGDVREAGSMEALATFTAKELGGLDVWVNNAGASQAPKAALVDSEPSILQGIVDTNLTGALFGSRAALREMARHDAGGRVFLVDGTGAWGNPTPGNVAYGATKRALTQLKESLVAETRRTKVAVHLVSPGMVATDLLLAGPHSESAKRIINVLAEDAAAVAAWLVPRMRGVAGNGRHFKYLTARGALWRFLTASRRRGRFLPEASARRMASTPSSGSKTE